MGIKKIVTSCVALLAASLTASGALAGDATATVHGDEDGGKISRHLYGHFAEHLGRCVYDGLYVGDDSDIPNTDGVRDDVVEALKAVDIPNLRWPGGCFADDYHWRDGIGPKDQRPRTINIHWGQKVEDNGFGTHEFFDLCERLGCEPYLAGNMGSGTPAELRDWVEYITSDSDSELANLRRKNGRDKPWKLKYLGVGNESWGCGGEMRPEFYSDQFRQYAMFCRNFGDNRLVRIACGPSGSDVDWNNTVMKRVGRQMQGYSIHKYTLAAPWSRKLPSTGFEEAQWFSILREAIGIERQIREAEDAMDPVDPEKRIGLFVDEWGTWYDDRQPKPDDVLWQQNTLRDALVAGLSFHVFHEHNDRIVMANIAQTVNVLQAMLLTDGPKLVLTPTYHVFDMYKVHHDATRLPVDLESPDYEHDGAKMPALSVAASRDADGVVHVTVVNAHAHDAMRLECELAGVDASSVSGRVLTAEDFDARNTFDDPDNLEPTDFDGAKIDDGKLAADLPARSVVVLTIEE